MRRPLLRGLFLSEIVLEAVLLTFLTGVVFLMPFGAKSLFRPLITWLLFLRLLNFLMPFASSIISMRSYLFLGLIVKPFFL